MSHYLSECSACGLYASLNDDALCEDCQAAVDALAVTYPDLVIVP